MKPIDSMTAAELRAEVLALRCLDKYNRKRDNARRAGVAFNFTPSEWQEFWGDDIDRTGLSGDNLICARIDLSGPYSPANCVKRTNAEHTAIHRSKRRA